MERELEGGDARRIRIYTATSKVEGELATSHGVSTLHYLNVMARSHNLMTLRPPVSFPDSWNFEQAPLSVTTNNILFVVERSDYKPAPGNRQAAARFHRSPISLRVSGYAISGYIHVAQGGDPLARLNQDRHTFVAITSASVIGAEEQFAAPFMAVNRAFINAAQCLDCEAPAELEPEDDEFVPIGE